MTSSSIPQSSARVRFVFACSTLGLGGQERQLHLLLEHLDRERHPAALLVWSYAPGEPFEKLIRELGIPIHAIPRGLSAPSKLRRMRAIVRSLDPAVVQSYSFVVNFPVWWATFGTKAVAVGAIRSTLRNYRKMWGWPVTFPNSRWPRNFICNSRYAERECRSHPRLFSPGRVRVVPNAIDLARYPASFVPPGEPFHVVGLGRLIDSKRWDRLVGAVAELRRQGKEVRLTLAGDGPLRQRLGQLVEEASLSDRVEFAGSVRDVPSLLASATVVVHTSEEEGQPNAILEAMACGRPVVAMLSGDVAEIVDDGVTGFVVPEGDAAALVDRIVRVLSEPELWARMARAAREKVETDYDPQGLVRRTLETYRLFGWAG